MTSVEKFRVNDLAAFGGTPQFDYDLHVGRPSLGNKAHLIERIETILESRWFTNAGPFVQEFENRLCDFTGAKHCIAMCNGTVALEIAIRATEMRGEVIVPALTFVATAHALQWQEITPVFCDIELDKYTIDPQQIERLITPRTTGIIGVHLWGRPCNVEALQTLADRHNLTLMFDAAHAFGCSYKQQIIGQFGDAEIFSFHATKLINCFEGGAVATNNDELARKIRLMKNFGFSGLDNVTHVGTNGKMSEVCAAMGITSLEDIDHFIDTHRLNYMRYRDMLASVRGIRLLPYNQNEKCSYPYITIEVDQKLFGITRDQLVHVLRSERVLARRYFYPGVHRMEPYRSYFPNAGIMLPNTEYCVDRFACLPTGIAVSPDEIRATCDIIRFVHENSEEIRRRELAL